VTTWRRAPTCGQSPRTQTRRRAPISGLWTAAKYNIPVVFVVARNSEYAALKKFTRLLNAPNTPGLELPGMDIVGIATSYGIPAEHVDSLSDLTRTTKDALASDGPRLLEVTQRRLADS
jgi:benzoylformate decarboxylase